MPFISCQEGNATNIFIKESEIIDRFVGNQLWGWGYNTQGGLGNNSIINQSSPVQTVSQGTNWKQVSLGLVSGATKTDGTLWLWGYGYRGGLGNNSTTVRSSPVQTVSTGTNWKQVAAGASVAGAIKTDGTLWAWGLGSAGSLGNYSTINQSSPVQTVSQGTNWKQVSLSSAIKTDGTLWLWGNNQRGKIGNNSTINHSSPVQTISTGTNWKQVSSDTSLVGSVKCDGTLWLWGCNTVGQLGNNSTIDRSSPVQTVSTSTNWKQVSVGSQFSSAIKIDGTLWVWGGGSSYSVGNNSTIQQSSPVQTVSTGTNWKQVSVGSFNISAIKTDGTLWVWGSGSSGALGTNNTIAQSSPVQTISSGTNWKQVSAGFRTISAVTFTDL